MKRLAIRVIVFTLLAVIANVPLGSAFSHSVAPRFRVLSISGTPDGHFLIAGSYPNQGGVLRLVSAEGQTVRPFDVHTRTVSCGAMSPDGRLVVSAGDVWATPCELFTSNSVTGSVQQRLQGHNGVVMALAISPDGKYLATGGGSAGSPDAPGELLLWNLSEGSLSKRLIGHSGMIFSVTFSPDGKFLASGSADTTIRIWNVDDGQQKVVLSGHTDRVTSVRFDPTGERLASGCGAWGNPGEIRVWQTSDWQLEHVFAFKSQINAIAFSPSGTLLAAGGGHRNLVALCDLKSVKHFPILESSRDISDEVYSLAFSSDGARIAVGGQKETIAFRDASVVSMTTSPLWPVSALILSLVLAGLAWTVYRSRVRRIRLQA